MRLLRMLIVALVVGLTVQAGDRAAWENLNKLSAGQRIEVTRKSHEVVRGTFVSVAADSVQLRDGQQDIAVPRSEVSRIRRSMTPHKGTWIGLAVGGGAGAAIGAGASGSLSNASGGDFESLRPAVIGIFTAIGVIAGLGIGYWIDTRHRIVYDIK